MTENKYLCIACMCVMLVACKVKQPQMTDNDWTLQELNGRVAKITETMCNLKVGDTTKQVIIFDTLGMITQRSFYQHDSLSRQFVYGDSMRYEINGNGEIQWIVYLTKDDKGRITEEYVQSPASDDRISYYVYNDKGFLVSETVENDEQEIVSITNYEYNDAGMLTKQIELGTYGDISLITLYEYTKHNKPVEIGLYNGENQCVQRQVYKYDKAGNETEERYLDAWGNEFYCSRTVYENNKPVSKTCTGTNIYEQEYVYIYKKGVLKSSTISEYDSIDGMRQLVILTERECDGSGNWVEEKVTEPDVSKQPTIITHRSIEYYGD